VCKPSDQCHVAGTCNPATGICSNPSAADGTTCNDGNACTQTDTCQSGTCVGSNPIVCTASDICHVAGTCDPDTGRCSNPTAEDGTTCDDGDACTQTDACKAGVCVGGNPKICTPSDQCHDAGICDPKTGICSNPDKTDGSACSDGDACTQTDSCKAGVCTGGNPVVCTAKDDCHVTGECDKATGLCSNPIAKDGTGCDDGNACTKDDVCTSGVCAGTAVVCPPPDQCHTLGVCNPETGLCSNPAKADKTPCNDGNACTEGDVCLSGACMPGTAKVCTASDQCHNAGICDPKTGICSNPAKPNGTSCGDGAFCNGNETCKDGTCTPGTSPCNAANCETCDETNDKCVSKCPVGTQCDGKGNCANICTKRTESVYCPSTTGHGFKCCPTDSICDYRKGVVNCRNP
jgi:hypothetical protein